MSGDIYRKPSQGQPFVPSARQTSAFIDAAIAVRELKRPGQLGGTVTPSPGVVYVKNNTGAALPKFAVLALGEPRFDANDEGSSFFGQVVFQGDTPASEDTGKFCILLKALGNGDTGPAVAIGVVQCLVDDGVGDFAEIVVGETSHLARRSSGSAKILTVSEEEAPDQEGKFWAIVALGAGAGGTTSSDGTGLPPEAVGCSCSDCVEGTPSDDCEGCGCVSNRRELYPPKFSSPGGTYWPEASSPRRTYRQPGTCIYRTGTFDGLTCTVGEGEDAEEANNVYRWKSHKLDDAGHPFAAQYLGKWITELELVEDNGCPIVTAIFRKIDPCQTEGEDCTCAWTFTRGIFNNIQAPIPCRMCLSPISQGRDCCGFSLARVKQIGGTFGGREAIRENAEQGPSCFDAGGFCSSMFGCAEEEGSPDWCGQPDTWGPPYGTIRAPASGFIEMSVGKCWGSYYSVTYLATLEEDELECPKVGKTYVLTPSSGVPEGEEDDWPTSMEVTFLDKLGPANSSGHVGGACGSVDPCDTAICKLRVHQLTTPLGTPYNVFLPDGSSTCESAGCGFCAPSSCDGLSDEVLGNAADYDPETVLEKPCDTVPAEPDYVEASVSYAGGSGGCDCANPAAQRLCLSGEGLYTGPVYVCDQAFAMSYYFDSEDGLYHLDGGPPGNESGSTSSDPAGPFYFFFGVNPPCDNFKVTISV